MDGARAWRTAPAWVTLAAALTGCSSTPDDRACTEIGAESGVTLAWRPADFGDRDAATVRLCVWERCEEKPSGNPKEPEALLTIPVSEKIGGDHVAVRLTVTSRDDEDEGEVIVKDRAIPRLAKYQPNGPDCEPTAWQATFRADPEEGLVAEKVAARK
ncbi:hypothetical protein [Streptomyces sp. NPDC002490]|uniref:hypothetical protein n=1 Tax=Streptomyces sp. NPDC002490 TaxID=3154416 RepID=UPI003318C527